MMNCISKASGRAACPQLIRATTAAKTVWAPTGRANHQISAFIIQHTKFDDPEWPGSGLAGKRLQPRKPCGGGGGQHGIIGTMG